MAADPQTLDIAQPQILINLGDEDRDYPHHHRVLLHRVEKSRWAVLTPDLVRAVVDLAEEDYTQLQRASKFPKYAVDEGLYYFDPV